VTPALSPAAARSLALMASRVLITASIWA
jgi:hypothetical protein